ncbi:hypothetical protein F9802_01110 [Bacillus aerolatus]|uniref:General secretion pathway GspH domain-containing protein n=1 Tax=Bacillus aerolatus TaxID=2653354 RepID=A0A6I1FJ99_9BACI|nr:competence type IV pilus minor pilin ComGD [Bacillus aerolatus]KAB7708779.1 hypothetical protein F9802_01110 [Bacillus aerolatus]
MLNKMILLLKSEKGFSILEMLLILSIMLVLLSVTVLPLPKLAANFEKKQFFNQLQADLFLAQSYAIAKQDVVEVKFLPAGDRYSIHPVTASSVMLIQRNMPDSIRHVNGSLAKLSFLPNGNTSSFGTVHFKYQDQYISLIFQIGKGRFYVKEQ